MLVTEKVGPVWLVTQDGQKTPVANASQGAAGRAEGGMPACSAVAGTTPRTTRLPDLFELPDRRRFQPGVGAGQADAPASDEREPGRPQGDLAGRRGRRRRPVRLQIACSAPGRQVAAPGPRATAQRFTPAFRIPTSRSAGKMLHLTLDGQAGPPTTLRCHNGNRPARPAYRSSIRPSGHRGRPRPAAVVRTYTFSWPEPDAVRDLDQRPPHTLRPGLRPGRQAVGTGAPSVRGGDELNSD